MAAVIAACVTLLALAAPAVIQHESATDVSPAQGRRIRRGASGLVAGLVAILLLAAATRSVRRRLRMGDRLLAAGLLAGAVTYAVHALYDWDWEIPGVMLPALAVPGRAGRRDPGRPWPRARDGNALLAASAQSGAGLRPALSDALLADRLDPVSDRGLLVAATVEIHLRHYERARRYLVAAVERQPTDGVAWQRLAVQDLVLGDRHDAAIAGRRALALDIHGVAARGLAANLAASGRRP